VKAKRPGKKPTQEDMDDRIEYTAHLLSQRLLKCDIKRLLIRRYSITARTCEDYLSRAREALILKTGLDKSEHKIKSLAYYESVLANKRASVRDKLNAQSNIDGLLGLKEHPSGGMTNINTNQTVNVKNEPIPVTEEGRLAEALALVDLARARALSEPLAAKANGVHHPHANGKAGHVPQNGSP
jgi:hypothetical protein